MKNRKKKQILGKEIGILFAVVFLISLVKIFLISTGQLFFKNNVDNSLVGMLITIAMEIILLVFLKRMVKAFRKWKVMNDDGYVSLVWNCALFLISSYFLVSFATWTYHINLKNISFSDFFWLSHNNFLLRNILLDAKIIFCEFIPYIIFIISAIVHSLVLCSFVIFLFRKTLQFVVSTPFKRTNRSHHKKNYLVKKLLTQNLLIKIVFEDNQKTQLNYAFKKSALLNLHHLEITPPILDI